MAVRAKENLIRNDSIPKKPLRRDATKFPGWSKLINKFKRPSLWDRFNGREHSNLWNFVSEFYESKAGNLFITSSFRDRTYKTKTYELNDGTKRTEKYIDFPGTSVFTKRLFWHKTIALMIKSEYICPQCGSKREAKVKCCPPQKTIEDIDLQTSKTWYCNSHVSQ